MALAMMDKPVARRDRAEWPAALREEFEREARAPNGCVGSELVSETDKVRVWTIRLASGQRFGFHRHVLAPGETRHETYGRGEFKVHDLENIGDAEMVFMPWNSSTAPTSR